MLTRADESDLIEDIKDGIGIALEEKGASAKSIDSIKLNKLVYLAVTRLEIPITFGWYKYGPAPVDLHYSETAVTAKSEEECDAPYDSRLPERDYYSPIEYAYFFRRELDEFGRILQAPTKEFLVSFYEREAPPQYKRLYIKSAQLQQILDEIRSGKTWHDEAETYYREVSQRIGDVTREIMNIEALKEVRMPFRRYTRFLKSLIAHASTIGSLSEPQQRFIKRIVDYYYGSAWKYAALKISENTVHLSPGHNQEKLLTSIENDRQELRADYEDDLNRLEERAGILSLIEEVDHEETSTAANKKREQSEGLSDRSRAELWTLASSEAIATDYTDTDNLVNDVS